MTWRCGSRPKCWKTMLNRRRRSSRSFSWLALRMSSPSRRTSPAVGSIRRVMQRTSVDLPLPDNPMTTKTSPGQTSNETSRNAIIEPVFLRSSSRGRSASGVPMVLCSAGPKTFHRPRTARVGVPVPPSRVGRSMVAVTLTSPLWSPCPGAGHPPNHPVGAGAVFCQMCFASRYSSRPLGPSSRPMPDCLKPPHSASGMYVL